MVYELVSAQLVRNGAALCVLCNGKTMNGLGCTCYSHASWLYRASQGRIKTNGCNVRDLTNDCAGGTTLRQMQGVSAHYGITTGAVYLPINIDQVFAWVETGRYGSHLNIRYEPFVNTPYDRFSGRFKGNHDIYLSKRGAAAGTIRVMDPGIGTYHDIPKTILRQSAGLLGMNDSGSVTLNDEAGRGRCYAYVTPADPATTSIATYRAVISGRTPLYVSPNGATAGTVSAATYTVTRSKVAGLWWYRITTAASASRGRYFKPTRYTHITVI